MIKVIKNGLVITMDSKRKEKIEKLDIVIKNDTIIEITNNYNGTYDELIDATDKVIIPGLVNCHTHLGMSIFRATNDNLNLNDWLNNKIWPIEDKLTDNDMYYTSLLSCIEMIKTGTTLSNDMYYNCQGVLKAIKETKVRSLFSRCVMDSDNNGDTRFNEFVELYNNNDNQLIRWAVAPHAFYTCSENYLKKCSVFAKEHQLPVHIHFCENEGEVKGITEQYGSPIKALEKTGLINNKLILAHGTFIENIEDLKYKDVSIVHNPVSNLNLGCGIANITKYKNYVNVCLGTDGQGSGNNLNLFYNMSLVDFLQKGIYKNPTVFNSYETLKMATINGAKALGYDDIVGSIEVGKKADIIILDYNKIETYPLPDLITGIVHNTESSNVDTTIINGEVLMKNHKLLLDINEDNLMDKINEIYKRVI
ncbi:MAG: amidohydrolase [Bacilli bacterium]